MFKLQSNFSLQVLLHIVHHMTKFDVQISKGLAGSSEFMKWLSDEKKRLSNTSINHDPSCSPTKLLFSYIQDFISNDPFTKFFNGTKSDVVYKTNSLLYQEIFDFPVGL